MRKKSSLCPPFFKTLFNTSDCNKLNIAFDRNETILLKKKKNNASQLLSPTRWDNVIGASSRIFLFPGALSIFVIYSSAGEGGCLVGDVTGSYINSLSASHPSFFKGRPGTRDGERKRERERVGEWKMEKEWTDLSPLPSSTSRANILSALLFNLPKRNRCWTRFFFSSLDRYRLSK